MPHRLALLHGIGDSRPHTTSQLTILQVDAGEAALVGFEREGVVISGCDALLLAVGDWLGVCFIA